MNIYTLQQYVNLDVDDSFSVEEIAQWFNKGIAQYNLLPPLTNYPYVAFGDEEATLENGLIDAYDDYYALNQTFMLGIMLPFINSAIRGQDASVQEKQIYLEEFLNNARLHKQNTAITNEDYLLDAAAAGLDVYRLGENVFISDMTRSPFQGSWSIGAVYDEITVNSPITEGETFILETTLTKVEE